MIITIKLHYTIVFIVVETTLFPLLNFLIDILHQYNYNSGKCNVASITKIKLYILFDLFILNDN